MAKFKKKPKVESDQPNVSETQESNPIVKKKKHKTKKKNVFFEKDVKKDEGNVDDTLTLDIVKELGGTEDDLKLLENIEGNDKDEDINEETENDLKSLIKSLKFGKFKSETFIAPENDDDEEEETANEEVKASSQKLQDSAVSSSSGNADIGVSDKTKDESSEDEEEQTLLPGHLVKRQGFPFVKDTPSRTHSVIKSGGETKWYETTTETDMASPEEAQRNKYWTPKLEKYTQTVWDLDVENYKTAGRTGRKRGENQWIHTVLKSGTLNDKMSAYVILLQDSPVHNLSVLDTLISLVSLKSRRPCLMAVENLQQMFLSHLLVPTRKLRNFDRNNFGRLEELSGGNKDTRDRYLISWLYEDRLKKTYSKFLEALDQIARDTVDKTKITALSTVFELLAGNPEQESSLLERLCNKLGDPTRAVAAKAMYLLSTLLDRHPAMKLIVVGEVERLLYRANISTKAQYYGICFLSQILLEKHNTDNLAAKLIGIYFSFFKMSVKSGEVDTKLMKALLTGVNRGFPYASLAPQELDSHMETMHKLVHLVSFNTAIQALTLLHQVMDSREAVTDRFYSALYKKILDPALPTSSKQVMFLNLLYKAIKSDPSLPRVKAFIKRLLQVCEYLPCQLVCGLLYLMSELLVTRPDLSTIQQVLQDVNTAVDVTKFEEESDDEECYTDVKDEEEVDKTNKKPNPVTPGWTFKSKSDSHVTKTSYDPSERNPLYSGAEKSAWWELGCLENHFHPSAALFARNLLDNVPIKYSGDPLSDFTIARFLDRFVFRNPKKNPEKNKPTTVLGKRNIYRPSGSKALAPDSNDFRNRDLESVPEDEVYIYKYFKEKVERKGEKNDDDSESVTSEEFNSFLDKMGGRSNDFDDENIDFAGGVSEEKKGKRKSEDDDEEDEGADEEQPEESDDEPAGLDGEDDGDFQDLSSGEEDIAMDDGDMDLDEEGFGGSDEFDFDEEGFGEDDVEDDDKFTIKLKAKPKKTKFPKFDPNNLESIFADADNFAHLLEENDDKGQTESVANSDKANKKQLAWEKDRDTNIKGGNNWKAKKKPGGAGKPGKSSLPQKSQKPFKKQKKK